MFSATIELVERGDCDISMNSYFIQDFGTNNVEILYPDSFTRLRILVPRNYYAVSNSNLFRRSLLFNSVTIVFIVISSVTFSLFSVLILVAESEFILSKMTALSRTVIPNVFFSLSGLILNQSINIKSNIVSRILYGSALVHYFFLIQFWQSQMQADLVTTDDHKLNIETLQELLDNNLILNVADLTDGYVKLTNNVNLDVQSDSLHEQLLQRLTWVNPEEFFDSEKRSNAFLTKDNFLDIIREDINCENGHPCYHHVSEEFYAYFKAMVVSKSYPWTNVLNQLIIGFQENGLTEYYDQEMRDLVNSIRIRKNLLGYHLVGDEEMIGLWHLRPIFVLYVTGILGSIFVFALEIYIDKVRKVLNSMKDYILRFIMTIFAIFKCLAGLIYNFTIVLGNYLISAANSVVNYIKNCRLV